MKKQAEERIREHLAKEFKDFEAAVGDAHWDQINSKMEASRTVRARYALAALLILISGIFTSIYYWTQDETNERILVKTEVHSGKEDKTTSIKSTSEQHQQRAGIDDNAEVRLSQELSVAVTPNDAALSETGELYPEKMDNDNMPLTHPHLDNHLLAVIPHVPKRLSKISPHSLDKSIRFPEFSEPQMSHRKVWFWQLEIGASANFANLQPNTNDEIVFDLYRDGFDLNHHRFGLSPNVLINRVISPRVNLGIGVGIHWRQFQISEDYDMLNEFGEPLEGGRLNESLSIWSAAFTPMVEYSLSAKPTTTWLQLGLEYEPWISATEVTGTLLDIPNHEVNVILGARRPIIRTLKGAGYLRGYGYYALNRRYTSGALRAVPYGFGVAVGWSFIPQ